MNIVQAFQRQLEGPGDYVYFLAYGYPVEGDHVSMMKVTPAQLSDLKSQWELMDPVFSVKDSMFPRLQYIDKTSSKEAFEAWVRQNQEGCWCLDWTGNDPYDHERTMLAWDIWQAITKHRNGTK